MPTVSSKKFPLTVTTEPAFTVVFETDKVCPCAPLMVAADESGMEETVIATTSANNFFMAKL
jgi:hypothetical protein